MDGLIKGGEKNLPAVEETCICILRIDERIEEVLRDGRVVLMVT